MWLHSLTFSFAEMHRTMDTETHENDQCFFFLCVYASAVDGMRGEVLPNLALTRLSPHSSLILHTCS